MYLIHKFKSIFCINLIYEWDWSSPPEIGGSSTKIINSLVLAAKRTRVWASPSISNVKSNIIFEL